MSALAYSYSLGVCAALRVLGLGSWLVSQLRVARGLATGAVERSEESVVQRRVNCSVGPWEKLSKGGKHYQKEKREKGETKSLQILKLNCAWGIAIYSLFKYFQQTPFHPGWSPKLPSSCWPDTPPSLAWTPHTHRPIAANVCTDQQHVVIHDSETQRNNTSYCMTDGDSLRVGASPVFIKDSHLSHKCGFPLLHERGAPPLPIHYFLCEIWNTQNDMNGFSKMQDLKNLCVQRIFCDTYGKAWCC